MSLYTVDLFQGYMLDETLGYATSNAHKRKCLLCEGEDQRQGRRVRLYCAFARYRSTRMIETGGNFIICTPLL